MTTPSGEAPVLRVDAKYGKPTPMDGVRIALGADPELLAADYEGRLETIEFAKKLGMIVVVGEPEDYQPGEYAIRGLQKSKAQENKEVKVSVPDILMPHTSNFQHYSQNPFFPALAKDPRTAGGAMKYLLEAPEQWQKFYTWMTGGKLRVANEQQAQYWGKDSYEQPLRGFEEDLQGWFEYQEFITTPSDRYTSYRVLATPNGTILTSSLYYSGATKNSADILTSDEKIEELGTVGSSMTAFLTNPESLVYLGAKNIISNHVRGGNGVVLNRNASAKPIVEADKPILLAHGLDPQSPQLPTEIAEKSKAIARVLGPSQGIVMGIDWIQEEGTGNYYYLETNFGPGPVAFADAFLEGEVTTVRDHIRARAAMERAAIRSLVEFDA